MEGLESNGEPPVKSPDSVQWVPGQGCGSEEAPGCSGCPPANLQLQQEGKVACGQRELSGALWAHLRTIPGLLHNQTSPALSESSITLIRSDRL